MALVWFFGFGALGMYLPFFGLYLNENAGLGGARVGAVLAVMPLVGGALQPPWGQLADRTGAGAGVRVAASFGGTLGFAALWAAGGFAGLVLATAFLAVFLTAFVPAAVAMTIALARRDDPHAFGLSRVWGTVGFLFFVVAVPHGLEAVQEAWGLERTPGGPSEPG